MDGVTLVSFLPPAAAAPDAEQLALDTDANET
jgi:hypothetical protein